MEPETRVPLSLRNLKLKYAKINMFKIRQVNCKKNFVQIPQREAATTHIKSSLLIAEPQRGHERLIGRIDDALVSQKRWVPDPAIVHRGRCGRNRWHERGRNYPSQCFNGVDISTLGLKGERSQEQLSSGVEELWRKPIALIMSDFKLNVWSGAIHTNLPSPPLRKLCKSRLKPLDKSPKISKI